MKDFVRAYFSQERPNTLFVGGAGFDPRAAVFPDLFSELGAHACGLLLKEERPDPDEALIDRATENTERLLALFDETAVVGIDVFGDDGAVVVGRSVVAALKDINVRKYSDVVIDLSALSIGASFPLTQYFLQLAEREIGPRNVHLVVAGHSRLDEEIVPIATERVVSPHGFRGRLGIDETQDAARLWMPQLSTRKQAILHRIHDTVLPHDIAPILPFPARNPRLADELIDQFSAELDGMWEVDARNLVYAAESNPLDLYRTLLRIDDQRGPVFKEVGGALLVLSPVGTKVLALGALMAAIERELPVLYVEAAGYQNSFADVGPAEYDDVDLVHVWLHGDACPTR